MRSTTPNAIPFERQSDDRTCGAAALAMAYRSFGIECTQAELWPAINVDESGARTQLIVRDALSRGLEAIAVQLLAPWTTLRLCVEHSIALIVNHRPNAASTRGHFSVVSAVDDDYLLLHDPAEGPDRVVARTRFLELWQRNSYQSQIAGLTLAAISRPTEPPPACDHCGAAIPETVQCIGCRRDYRLRPGVQFGCYRIGCSRRNWLRVYCPHCDAPFEAVMEAPLFTQVTSNHSEKGAT